MTTAQSALPDHLCTRANVSSLSESFDPETAAIYTISMQGVSFPLQP